MRLEYTELDDNGNVIMSTRREGLLAWEFIKGKKPYNGKRPANQQAYLKPGYKGKNENGGRKCIFRTATGYR